MYVADAGPPVVLVVVVLAVAVSVGDAVPDDGERRPADDERGAKQDHVVAPAHVDQRREDVDEVATTSLRHVLTGDIARSVLVDDPARLTGGEASAAVDQSVEDPPVTHRPVGRRRRHCGM